MEDLNNYAAKNTSNSVIILAVIALVCAIASLAAVAFVYMQLQSISADLLTVQVQAQTQDTVEQTRPTVVENLGPSFDELGVGAPPPAVEQAAYQQWAIEYGEALRVYNEENGLFVEDVDTFGEIEDDAEEEARIQQEVEAEAQELGSI